jgi:hypothetical protein
VVAVVVDSAMARAVLATFGLPCSPATFTPARAPPQLWFDAPLVARSIADRFGAGTGSAPTSPIRTLAYIANIQRSSPSPPVPLGATRRIRAGAPAPPLARRGDDEPLDLLAAEQAQAIAALP